MNSTIRRTIAASGAALAIVAGIAGTSTAAPALDAKGSLERAFAPGAAPAQRAAELEAGDRGVDTANRISAQLERVRMAYPGYTWNLGPVSINGAVANSTLTNSVPGYTYSQPLTWKLIGGKWKLSNASECALAAMAFTSCNV